MCALWGGGRGIHFEGATPAKRHQFRMKLLRVKLRVCRWHGLCDAKGSSSPQLGFGWPGQEVLAVEPRLLCLKWATGCPSLWPTAVRSKQERRQFLLLRPGALEFLA